MNENLFQENTLLYLIGVTDRGHEKDMHIVRLQFENFMHIYGKSEVAILDMCRSHTMHLHNIQATLSQFWYGIYIEGMLSRPNQLIRRPLHQRDHQA